MSVPSPLTVTRDTYVNQDNPAHKYADQVAALAVSGASSHQRRSFMFMAPPPRNVTVVAATLHLFTRSSWPSGSHVTVQRISQSWSESQVNWNNQPNTSGVTATSAVGAVGTEHEVTVDVTAIYQAASNGANWYGLRLVTDATSVHTFYASEAQAPRNRPYLVLEYSEAPDAAANLSPDGEVNVYETSPSLAWTFRSRTATAEQAQSRVLVTTDDDDDFASPVYDSGWVTNLVEGWDLDGEVTLSDDTAYLWKVAVRDENGGQSDYSDTASFSVNTGGALTITFPATDGDDVEQVNPDITWTFTSATQESWRATLYDSQGKLLVTSGRQANTDTTWSIPSTSKGKPYITKPTEDYSVGLEVWDDVSRPGPKESIRTFVFEESGDPEVPVLVSMGTDGPGVKYTFTVVTPADAYAFYVDGRVVRTVDSDDDEIISNGGDSYSWSSFLVDPSRSHPFRVAAIVGTDVGAASNAISFLPRPLGIWIVDSTQHLAIQMLEQNPNPESLQQSGDTFYMLNRADPIRIVGRTQGMAGHISGSLNADADLTLTEKLDAVRDEFFGDEVNLNVQLVYGRSSRPVIVGNLELSQHPARTDYFSIEFDWWETTQ